MTDRAVPIKMESSESANPSIRFYCPPELDDVIPHPSMRRIISQNADSIFMHEMGRITKVTLALGGCYTRRRISVLQTVR